MLYQSSYFLSSGSCFISSNNIQENNNEIVKPIINYKQKTQCDGCGAPVQKSYWSCNYCGRDYWN
jgi:hypothetical protein